MADLEIRKHAKQALKTLAKEDRKGPWHKIKEFFLEIFIIVFAVSLSIWLHGLSEKSHQAEEVREFLTDLKSDLAADKERILKVKKQLTISSKGKLTPSPDAIYMDTLRQPVKNQHIYLNFISRKANSGNYEGFKSSGNIGYIHNKILKRKILKYYEQDVQSLEDDERIYNNQMEKVMDLVLSENKAVRANAYFLDTYMKNVIKNYDVTTSNIDSILIEINKDLK
ncbi:hypothetical protein [Chryseobacterium sp. OSA05B]|uniref:hypothetical protein n=1 Tax=Chryseobacterium sp. OSA05B TaxID=2862650 RepID=UPI001CBB0B1E|nr:hypothetical protein [Chryseobacterium sp. OSA05B]